MTPLRIGFAGCGRATTHLHLPALRRVRGAVVTAVADVDARRRDATAAAWNIPRRHADAAALAADPDVDLVAVCVPPAQHVEAALAALDAGRHLFVEKPLALSLEEADRLAAHPAMAGVTAAVGFNLRHHRQVRIARELVAAGRLGEIGLLRTELTGGLRLRSEFPAWRRERAEGGGVLWELAVHHADLWRFLLGDEIAEVNAHVRDVPFDDDAAALTARTAGGVVVAGTFAQGTSDSHEVELAGDRAALHLNLIRGDGVRLMPVGQVGGGPALRAREALRSLADLPRQVGAARRGGDLVSSFAAEWADVVAAVRSGRPPIAGLQDGRRAMAIVLAAARSAEEGRPVAVEELARVG